MNTHDIELPPLPRPQVPRIDADIDLVDIRRLAAWCEKTAKDYARAAIEAALQSQDRDGGYRVMAPEYQRWIDAYHQGMDYEDFLKKEARLIEGEGE